MKQPPPDDLDRQLFSLPLEEPPAQLRSAILAATVYRPPFPMKTWETWVLGALAALSAWLGVLVVQGGSETFTATFASLGAILTRMLVANNTLLWLAVGGSVTFLALMINLSPIPVYVPRRLLRR
ncbi:MAG: hypothetical protein NVS1B14_05310 [Vulcanimicrobiaceae bacterium]